jgi:hypothetical protein
LVVLVIVIESLLWLAALALSCGLASNRLHQPPSCDSACPLMIATDKTIGKRRRE